MSWDLHWLPSPVAFAAALAEVRDPARQVVPRMETLRRVVDARLDFLQTQAADRSLQELLREADASAGLTRVRLAVLATCTVEHLLPGIRIGALRRGLLAECWVAPFGQLEQTVLETASPLVAFAPEVVLFVVDHRRAVQGIPCDATPEVAGEALRERVDELATLWRAVQARTQAAILQQTVVPLALPLFGALDGRLPGSPVHLNAELDRLLAQAAAGAGVSLLDLGWWSGQLGARELADPMLWHAAKQEISPAASPLYGDLVGRALAALRGRSRKCLVLDLDGTLWGGVLGEDGLEGIVLGPGSALGEAHLELQRYLERLAARGVLLAICSKNDEALVLEALDRHPEMVLRRRHFAAIAASWDDKPAALQRLAGELSLSTEAMVFLDDSPVERALMRRTLPEVAVPELPEAVELYARCLADAGYFEAVAFTDEDAARTSGYEAIAESRRLQARTVDLDAFLRELQTRPSFAPFHDLDIPRIVQLVNKVNQFNLTGRAYGDVEVRELIADPCALTLSLRVQDRFGDHGLVAAVVGKLAQRQGELVVEIESWVMSCRVLGRRLEQDTLEALRRRAAEMGAGALAGRFVPTGRNELVHDLLPRLGFAAEEPEGGGWLLPIGAAPPPGSRIETWTSAPSTSA